MTFFGFSGLDRGEVGFGHLSELDVWDHDLPRHLIDRDTDALILLVEVFNLLRLFFLDLLLVLDQIVDILLKLTDPDLLSVPLTMAKIVADDTVLGLLGELGLTGFIESVENDHSEG